MKDKERLVVIVKEYNDIKKITDNTRYINIDITTCDNKIINYFINNGLNFLYSDILNNKKGYVYVGYKDFLRAETIISMIYKNIPKNLNKMALARYIYITLGKELSYDINIDYDKFEYYNYSLVNNISNIWGSLSLGKVNKDSILKIYYYVCNRLGIKVGIGNNYNEIYIDNKILKVDLYKDIPYIEANMQTKYFDNYNNEIELDKLVKYIKKEYNDYYIDKYLKNIDYYKENILEDIFKVAEDVIDIENINAMELSIIFKDIFDMYCPNYDIKINNLYINNSNKEHFIIISYNNKHYSYNYKEGNFSKLEDREIIDNINDNKIGLYKNELIPNINV